jgi:hypothetical protein
MRRPATPGQNEVIPELVQQIVEAVQPLRFVLFGSAARGDLQPETDIDLLVVMPEGAHRRRTAERLPGWRSLANCLEAHPAPTFAHFGREREWRDEDEDRERVIASATRVVAQDLLGLGKHRLWPGPNRATHGNISISLAQTNQRESPCPPR